MVKGIGNDIIEVDRIRNSIERHGESFLNKVFTKKEQNYCQKHQDNAIHFAGRFCAKEAVVKALGTGIGKEAAFHDIEILNNKEGKPEVFLSEKLNSQFNAPTLFVSISHTKNYATAIAIIT